METLQYTLKTAMAGYAGPTLNGESLLTASADGHVLTIVSIGRVAGKTVVDIGLIAHVVNQHVVIDRELNNKPLVDALLQAGALPADRPCLRRRGRDRRGATRLSRERVSVDLDRHVEAGQREHVVPDGFRAQWTGPSSSSGGVVAAGALRQARGHIDFGNNRGNIAPAVTRTYRSRLSRGSGVAPRHQRGRAGSIAPNAPFGWPAKIADLKVCGSSPHGCTTFQG